MKNMLNWIIFILKFDGVFFLPIYTKRFIISFATIHAPAVPEADVECKEEYRECRSAYIHDNYDNS